MGYADQANMSRLRQSMTKTSILLDWVAEQALSRRGFDVSAFTDPPMALEDVKSKSQQL